MFIVETYIFYTPISIVHGGRGTLYPLYRPLVGVVVDVIMPGGGVNTPPDQSLLAVKRVRCRQTSKDSSSL